LPLTGVLQAVVVVVVVEVVVLWILWLTATVVSR